MRTAATLLAAAAALAAAQQTVQVGANGQLAFAPPTLTAKAGETVHFAFADQSHTVTQAASLITACVPKGFDSPPGAQTFDVLVNGTDPIYVFCTPHCATGMVMIINPKSAADLDAFTTVAKTGKLPVSVSSSSSSATSSSSASTPPASVPSSSSATTANTGSASSAPSTTTTSLSPSASTAPSSGAVVAPSLLVMFGALVLAALL